MKTLHLGVGTERVNPTTRRFMLDVGIESTKPASEGILNAIVIMAVVVGFALSIYALDATDVEPTQTSYTEAQR